MFFCKNEFGTLSCDDRRNRKKFMKMAENFHARPGASIPAASGDGAGAKGCCRLLESGALDADKVIGSHAEAVGR